jgi:hypothetical protein
MPSAFYIFLCGTGALLFWGAIGLALSRRVAPESLALPIAPALGWAIHSAVALPVYRLIGFNIWTVASGTLVTIAAASLLLSAFRPIREAKFPPQVSYFACGLALVLGIIPALAILPKISGDAVALAPAIFDHAKITMIDDMSRLGLPPSNPFFAAAQEAPLAYYYLWHFSAAELSVLTGATGWQSDVALTAFTGIASLGVMIGFATWIGGRTAGIFVVPLALAASLHPVLEFVFGADNFYSIFLGPSGFAGWLFQSAWAPQHVASASCVVLSTYLLVHLARTPSPLLVGMLALLAAAGFESSTWVGGFLFAAAAPVMAIILFIHCTPRQRLGFAGALIVAAFLSAVLAYPFLHDQYINAAARQAGSPIVIEQYPVFTDDIVDEYGGYLNVPGYWLLTLALEFPAIYITGIISMIVCLQLKSIPQPTRLTVRTFAGLALVSLLAAGCVASTVAENNDLGWRAVLPAVFVLTIFAAAGLARWLTAPMPLTVVGALLLLALGLPRSAQLVTEYIRGIPSPSGVAFSATPEMWRAVRRHAGPADRIADNPLFMEKMTPWPVNISWALLANRRSCFAGRDLASPFTSLARTDIDTIDNQFRRVFAGGGTPDDIRDLAVSFRCRVAVVTSQDGAWNNDPFAASGVYDLAEEKPGQWKVYRAR